MRGGSNYRMSAGELRAIGSDRASAKEEARQAAAEASRAADLEAQLAAEGRIVAKTRARLTTSSREVKRMNRSFAENAERLSHFRHASLRQERALKSSK